MNGAVFDIHREALASLCRRYGVRELSAFGSAVAGGFSESSDIDLLVEFKPEALIGFMALSRMQRELSALFGRKVDLVPKAGLKPAIRQAILSSAEILYAA